MAGIKHYIDKEQAEKLKAEAEYLKIDVEDLIRIKLESSPSNKETLENLQKAIANLANRVQNCELILKRYCVISEAELLDLGYLRGAIEVQAQRNDEAVARAKEKEQKRLELTKKVLEEIEQYLL
ncbi:MAG: hypothetical protein AB4372_22270 [Xenococcus sp. (in: cyanobacteria)]